MTIEDLNLYTNLDKKPIPKLKVIVRLKILLQSKM